MDYILICLVSFFVAGLTFFSGFGLGTLLLPAFALFFPIETAIAATAAVHLANNIFKAFLIGKSADKQLVLLFAIPAAIAAFIGASLLNVISQISFKFSYTLFDNTLFVTPVKLLIAILMIFFALFEIIPHLRSKQIQKKYIPLGGILSGFFGGLSGHQGALRTAFLLRAGLDKKKFIGTIVLSAIIIDLSRLLVYGSTFLSSKLDIFFGDEIRGLIIAGTLCAFVGSAIDKYLLEKVTFKGIQVTVAAMLIILGTAIGAGFI
jgi:uncharacterized membrane protein YfcA